MGIQLITASGGLNLNFTSAVSGQTLEGFLHFILTDFLFSH